jgi:hypothetical protein
MYYDNEESADFWIIRDSWGSTAARVVAIGDVTSGSLDKYGKLPYFNGAKSRVYAEMYRIVKLDGQKVLEQVKPSFDTCSHNRLLATVSCPGTFAYERFFPENDSYKVKKLEV